VKRRTLGLTPAYAQIKPEDALLRENREGQQRVQVHAFHQQPVVIGRHAVLHEQEHQTAAQRVLEAEGGSGGDSSPASCLS
jgi:lipoate-protein ligase A